MATDRRFPFDNEFGRQTPIAPGDRAIIRSADGQEIRHAELVAAAEGTPGLVELAPNSDKTSTDKAVTPAYVAEQLINIGGNEFFMRLTSAYVLELYSGDSAVLANRLATVSLAALASEGAGDLTGVSLASTSLVFTRRGQANQIIDLAPILGQAGQSAQEVQDAITARLSTYNPVDETARTAAGKRSNSSGQRTEHRQQRFQ